jgi:hypothetical protein
MYNSKEFLYEILVKGEGTALMNLSYGDSVVVWLLVEDIL